MKYLVTGGAGFIGSNIVNSLVDAGHGVVVIDNESSDSHEYFHYNDKAKYYKHDICDYDKITNSYGTCSVLQAAREAGVRRVVYSSTSSAYGLVNQIPNVETQPDDCLNPYSVSKVSGEKLCKMYSDLFGLETVVFRYFNVYGENQPTRGQYAPVIGLFLKQAKENKPLTIVPDGEQRRDFTHISDVVNANILASTVNLNELQDFGEGEHKIVKYGDVFNLGTGTNYSVNEVAKMISENTTIIEPRVGESRETLANINKAKTVLGWKPKVILEQWISEQLNG